MKWFPKRFRSGGMRVTRTVHHMIRAGDAARAMRDWERAADQYGKAVALDPRLAHIQVQLGHALKEHGRLDLAQDAYQAASALDPDDREPWLYMGEVAGRLGRHDQEVQCYFRMLAINADDAEAAAKLASTLRHLGTRERASAIGRIRPSLVEAFGLEAMDTPIEGATTSVVAFDVSDLVPFLHHAKRPTGIQRVQLEVIAAVLTRAPSDISVALCCMDEASDRWRGMASSTFLRLAALLKQDVDPSQRDRIVSEVRLSLLIAPDFVFAENGVLINLGASWWLGNYFLALRNVQASKGTAYVPFVHDLIPILHPEWHVASLIGEFTNWFSSAIDHADAFLVNSEATRRDLVRAAALAGKMARLNDVAVVPLDAGNKAMARAAPVDTIAPADPFILMVGTVEPRKGHDTALAALRLLLARGSAPRLVCVGGRGWQNDDVFAMLAKDPILAAHVDLLSGIDDDTLARLYDQAMLTIYPSKYEGWGLPVTEALCRGKVVVTTSASSLPEAGGDFALYVPPDDPVALASTLGALIEDAGRLRELEKRIVKNFRPRSWGQIADQVVTEAVRVMAARTHVLQLSIRPAQPGCFYMLGRTTHLPPSVGSAAGEVYRSGPGWHWPDDGSSRVRDEEGACVAFTVPSEGGTMTGIRADVLLRGLAGRSCRWRVAEASGAFREGILPPLGRQWVSIEGLADVDGVIALTITGQAQPVTPGAALADRTDPDGFKGNSVGVEGFFFTTTDADGCVDAGKVEAMRHTGLIATGESEIPLATGNRA